MVTANQTCTKNLTTANQVWKAYHAETFDPASEAFTDCRWFPGHLLSSLFLIFFIHSQRCQALTQRACDTRYGTRGSTWDRVNTS